jgi:hypothetical protein
MTYFSKLFARFGKAPKSTTAPAPAPVVEPMVVEVAAEQAAGEPSIDGD